MSNKRQRLWIPEMQHYAPEPQFTLSQEIHLTLPKAQMAGYFEVELIEAATGRVKEHYQFPNVITVHAMNAMGHSQETIGSMIVELFVGTGSTTPTPNDLKLEAPIDSTNSNGGFADVQGYVTGSADGPHFLGNPYHFIRRTRVFTELEATGALTELGFRRLSGTPDVQLNRALFKNNSGTPITINKTSDDQLKIAYEMRLYPPTYQTSGSFVLAVAETTHSWTASAQQIADQRDWGWQEFAFGMFSRMGSDWIGSTPLDQVAASASVPANPTGTAANWGWAGFVNVSTRSLDPYVCGSGLIRKNSQWNPAVANFGPGGIQGLAIAWANNGAQLAVYFSDPIPKTDVDILKLTYEIAFTASVTSSQ